MRNRGMWIQIEYETVHYSANQKCKKYRFLNTFIFVL
jgi:hypothetical protein